MKSLSLFTAALCLSAGALTCAAADNGAARVPVLLELFTSEGCSSCPPADRLLEILDQKQPVAGADLIVLSEHVDYWDGDGWKDPFSSSQYTARQQEYTNRYNFDGVYTPQLVVDGRFGFVGSDGREASSAIQQAVRERKIPIEISNVARDGNQVTAHIQLRRAVLGPRRRYPSPQTGGHRRSRQRHRKRCRPFGSTEREHITDRRVHSGPQVGTRTRCGGTETLESLH
jgi:hypothetical protein